MPDHHGRGRSHSPPPPPPPPTPPPPTAGGTARRVAAARRPGFELVMPDPNGRGRYHPPPRTASGTAPPRRAAPRPPTTPPASPPTNPSARMPPLATTTSARAAPPASPPTNPSARTPLPMPTTPASGGGALAASLPARLIPRRRMKPGRVDGPPCATTAAAKSSNPTTQLLPPPAHPLPRRSPPYLLPRMTTVGLSTLPGSICSPLPVVTEDLQLPVPPLENVESDIADFASALTLQEPDEEQHASSVELLNTESFASISAPPTEVHNTFNGSSSTCPSSYEKLLAGAARSPSALTLQEQDVSSLDMVLVSSVEELITASSQTVLHINSSSSTLPSSCEKLLIHDAGSASALTLQERDVLSSEQLHETGPLEKSIAATPLTVATDVSPPSPSYLGSPILIRDPPDWYQTFYIRMDSGGMFHMYPKLNGPFQSLQEAEAAIDHHLDERRRAARLKKRHEVSLLDWMIQQCRFYPDGMPKKGPNSPACKNPNDHQRHLIQALLDQYNEKHGLFQDLAHELKDLVKFQWFFEDQRSYYHFNFTTKKKKADDNLFFAEVSRLLKTDNWVLNCCCMIKPTDDGHCNACKNNGSSELKHPQSKGSFIGGHINGYLPFGGDPCSDSDDEDDDAFLARLKFQFGN